MVIVVVMMTFRQAAIVVILTAVSYRYAVIVNVSLRTQRWRSPVQDISRHGADVLCTDPIV